MSARDSNSASRSFGTIELIIGPMFSGKTTELFRRLRRRKIAKDRTLMIKYQKDTRYSENEAGTHDRMLEKATAQTNLANIDVSDVDVIAIDEGQFFPDLVTCVEFWANHLGKTVIVAGLDATYERKPFPTIVQLVPLAERVDKLNAVCMKCHSDNGSFTTRISSETEVEVIGGADKYMSVCRKCYFM